MKRSLKLIAGVTLLEILLVLAVASMVIVMSIRYYQSANNSENANVLMEQVQNITAAADNLAQPSGSYTAASSSALKTVAGTNNMMTPYGVPISTGFSATGITITLGSVASSVCTLFQSKLQTNAKYTVSSCPSPVVTYTPANGS